MDIRDKVEEIIKHWFPEFKNGDTDVEIAIDQILSLKGIYTDDTVMEGWVVKDKICDNYFSDSIADCKTTHVACNFRTIHLRCVSKGIVARPATIADFNNSDMKVEK